MTVNYMAVLMEEIALEGLDGITLQALWVRLENRKAAPMMVDEPMREFLWRKIQTLKNVQFFKLQEPRPDMHLPKLDLKEPLDAEETLNAIMQQMNALYPFSIVDLENIRGSCSTFKTRRRLERSDLDLLTLIQCNEKYGSSLVIVASQEQRVKALFGSHLVWNDMTIQPYCMLECIGRGRHFGVYSYGSGSLQERMKSDPRTMFYMRSKLLKRGIITKQLHILKGTATMCRTYLFQLSRFHTPFKSIMTVRQERVLHTLQAAPARRMIYTDLRVALEMEPLPFKKLMASMQSNGVVTAQIVTFREMYPMIPEKETFNKSGVEKVVKLIVLQRDTLEEVKPEGDDSDDEDQEFAGVLDLSKQTLDRTLLYQAYQATEVAGVEGLTQRQIGDTLGLSKLDSRAICRQLTKEGFISVHMQDMGRQRTTRYTAIHLQGNDYELGLEKEKFISLTGSAKLLENLVHSDSKAPQQCVLKNLYEQALDISANEGVCTAEPEAVEDADTTIDEKETESEPFDDSTGISCRTLKRVNLILGLVLKNKIISDLTLPLKVICEEEAKEGYKYTMDRRSLFRMISKMNLADCVNLYKVDIPINSGVKKLTFLCSKDIDPDNSLIQSEIAQAKLRYAPEEMDDKDLLPPHLVETSPVSLAYLECIQDKFDKVLEINRKNRYGYATRFVRLRLMHQLLFYLAYDYSGDANLDQTAVREAFEAQNVYLAPACPKIFRSEAMDYRTFLSPMPKHSGWPRGWVLLADVIVRVPLSVFVRLVRLRHVVPGLEDYLADPVRRNYLLGHLPSQMRADIIGQSRRFVYSIFDSVLKMCYVGLVQFGPLRQKHKDQQFIFVNTNAVLIDTTPSPNRYCQIDSSISYARHMHHFNSLADVEAYWIDLHHICMTTNLGMRLTNETEEINVECVDHKPILLEACVIRQADEAPKLDVGILPGDQLGAGGLDSALFSFMKRNWNAGILPKDLRLVVQTLKKGKVGKKVRVQRIEVKPSGKSVSGGAANAGAKPRFGIRKRIARKVLKQTILKARKRKVASAVRGFRTKWSPEEDSLLLLCKAAIMFLTSDAVPVKVKVPLIDVAKVMHKLSLRAAKKDAMKCVRRMKNMFNKLETCRSQVGMYVEEAHRCPKINAKIANFTKQLKGDSVLKHSEATSKLFEDLVLTLKDKDLTSNSHVSKIILPDTLEEYHARFQESSALDSLMNSKKITQPTNIDQIRHFTAITLLFSSIELRPEREKYSTLLLHAFQQFPDEILRQALKWARQAGTVVINKRAEKSNVLPISATPFLFSSHFYFKLQSKVPFEVFQEARPMLKSLEENSEATIQVPKVVGGPVAVLFEGLAAGYITTSIDISSQDVKLEFEPDTAQREKDALIKAYQLIDTCQKKLIDYKESESGEIAAKRPRMESTVIRRSDVCFSDEEDDDEDDDVAVVNVIDESSLTGKERVVRENVEARLAFYATRDRLQDSRSVNEKRDRRARLTISPSPVHCLRTDAPLPHPDDAKPLLDKLERSV
ncbi:Hypothetical predicted protein [Cloeon dipterum]|uniref:B-block binding subunit of TFIIIC domain-containing protein n=4 Tax=Cloeon dipterum TaxID=197152 RepID=A0A8S1DD40_9INSE|nr:Hypothetical predicted protein [Cloeon dipterum]